MPFTPYHFGPSGLIGYILRKWIDLPVFVLANVIVDLEVLVVDLFRLGWPIHRQAHSFLVGAFVGALWGLIAYKGLPFFKWGMDLIKIPYQTDSFKMMISGTLGVWLHVLLDGIYHFDARPFWPMQKNYLWNLLSHSQIEKICIICFVIFAMLYFLSLKKQFDKD